MEDNFKFLMFTFVLASLFSMILFTVIIAQGDEYNKDSSEVTIGMDVTGINSTVYGFKSQADLWQSSFTSNSTDIISAGFGVISTGASSIFFIGTSMFTMIVSPFTFLAGIVTNVLKVPAWITTVILSLIIMAGVLGLYRLLKWGS